MIVIANTEPIALSIVEGCAQSASSQLAYSVWFQLYAISYQPYAPLVILVYSKTMLVKVTAEPVSGVKA